MKAFLSGKKTYIMAIVLAIVATYETVTGDLSIRQAIQEGRGVELLQAMALATLRAGIAKIGK